MRVACNPERATGNPAHITVTYPDEAPAPALLTERVRLAAARTGRFRLTVGSADRFQPPVYGAFLAVADPAGGVAAIRDLVLAPPFTRRERFALHVPLLHPDQGERLEAAWPGFAGLPQVGEFEVTELRVVGPDNALLAVFPLAPDAEPGAAPDRLDMYVSERRRKGGRRIWRPTTE